MGIVRARQPLVSQPPAPAAPVPSLARMVCQEAPQQHPGSVIALAGKAPAAGALPGPRVLLVLAEPPPPYPGWAWTAQVVLAPPARNPAPLLLLLANAGNLLLFTIQNSATLELAAVPQQTLSLLMDPTMPPEQTLRLIRNQDLTLRFRMQPPQDVTGWSITWKARLNLGGTAVLTKSVGAGITLTYPGKGIADVSLAASDTASLTVTTGLAADQGYVWELTRTDSGNRLILARGNLILEQEIV